MHMPTAKPIAKTDIIR